MSVLNIANSNVISLSKGSTKMVDFCGVGKISLFTSIMSKLLHFLLETTHDIVMLDHDVFVLHRKETLICLLKCGC